MTTAFDIAMPADLAMPRCKLPAPLEYLETVVYTWPASTAYTIPVAVHGDGTFSRAGELTSPDRFTCSFTEADIDPSTCLAPCCPGTLRQPQALSPTVYVDEKGWSMWMNGMCDYAVGTVHYQAYVSVIATRPAH